MVPPARTVDGLITPELIDGVTLCLLASLRSAGEVA
jgi:hypothetical protein